MHLLGVGFGCEALALAAEDLALEPLDLCLQRLDLRGLRAHRALQLLHELRLLLGRIGLAGVRGFDHGRSC